MHGLGFGTPDWIVRDRRHAAGAGLLSVSSTRERPVSADRVSLQRVTDLHGHATGFH